MNCVDTNDLFIDKNKIFHVFDVSDDNENHFVDNIDQDKNYFNRYDFKLTENCQYYDENKFNMEYAIIKNEKSINKVAKPMCNINIRSTAKNLSSFSDYLSNFDHDFTCIGISESWLNENNKELYHWNCYNTLSKCRPSKKGGGVSLYINEKIPFIERHDLNVFNEYTKSVFIEIESPN